MEIHTLTSMSKNHTGKGLGKLWVLRTINISYAAEKVNLSSPIDWWPGTVTISISPFRQSPVSIGHCHGIQAPQWTCCSGVIQIGLGVEPHRSGLWHPQAVEVIHGADYVG